MPLKLLPSEGFRRDVQATHRDGTGVVLHRFKDGGLLAMLYDDAIPAWEDADRLAATGYVFHYAEPAADGRLAFARQAYALVDIVDYVLWTDDAAVEATYRRVLAQARAEDESRP